MGESNQVNTLPPLPPGASLAGPAPADSTSAPQSNLPPLPSGASLTGAPKPPSPTPTPQPAQGESLFDNHNREGTYQMHSADGTAVQVPYSKVELAKHAGYNLAGGTNFMGVPVGEAARYAKDRDYDPAVRAQDRAKAERERTSGSVGEVGGFGGMAPDAPVIRGAIKGAGQVAGTVVHQIAKTRQESMAAQHIQPDAAQDLLNKGDAWLAKNTQPEGLGEKLGAALEMAGEFAYGEGEWRAMSKSMSIADKFKAVKQTLQFFAEHPNAERAVMTAARATDSGLRAGVVGAGQAAAHGATPADAATTGAITGTIGAAAEIGPAAIKAAINRVRPQTETIAETPVVTRQAQASEASAANARPATMAEGPATAKAQQAAVPKVIQNTARRALINTLEDVNATRGTRTIPAARQLPPPQGSEPFHFEIPTGPTQEVVEGQMAQPAAQMPGQNVVSGTTPKNVSELGSTAQTVPARAQRTAYMTSSAPESAAAGSTGNSGNVVNTIGTPEASTNVAKGGGVIKIADPAQAQLTLSRINQIIDSPQFAKMPEAHRAQFLAASKSLTEQLDMFHAWRVTQPHFEPIDSAAVASRVHNFGEVEDQLEANAKPYYQRLTDLTRNPQGESEFEELQRERRLAYRANDYERIKKAESGIDRIITENRNNFSKTEYQQANKLWAQSKLAGKFHWALDGAANASEDMAKQKSAGRVFNGNAMANRLNKIEQEYGRERIDIFLGDGGYANMHRMADLVSNPRQATNTVEALKNIGTYLFHRGGTGAIIGGIVGGFTDMGTMRGAEAGVATEAVMRKLYNYAATSPRIGSLLDYAVKNGVSPKVYVPLIAGEIERENTPDQPQEKQP